VRFPLVSVPWYIVSNFWKAWFKTSEWVWFFGRWFQLGYRDNGVNLPSSKNVQFVSQTSNSAIDSEKSAILIKYLGIYFWRESISFIQSNINFVSYLHIKNLIFSVIIDLGFHSCECRGRSYFVTTKFPEELKNVLNTSKACEQLEGIIGLYTNKKLVRRISNRLCECVIWVTLKKWDNLWPWYVRRGNMKTKYNFHRLIYTFELIVTLRMPGRNDKNLYA
jgi:hypothetical protein